MLKLFIQKELRDLIGSRKFALTFGACALLIILCFYAGGRNYQIGRAQYEATLAANLRQMEGLTEWESVRQHRIFLPPQPLAALVSGISNDIGRTIQVQSRGELSPEDSRYNDEPVYALFRFLDLEFIFQVVLSLFAVLLAYDAINGEKERGTLRLIFSNAVPRDQFILGKIAGAFLALSVPLLLPILLGCLILVLMGIPLNSTEWFRLTLIIAAGVLMLGAFLAIAVFISSITQRSSTSFLFLLVIWILLILIVPRTSVLLAGRAIDVPSLDEHASQRHRLQMQLWNEDNAKINGFRPKATGDPELMMREFNQFMQKLGEEREKKMTELNERLNEERRNRELVQASVAFGLARISPAAGYSLIVSNLAGTSLALQQNYSESAKAYQQVFAKFMKEKTGGTLGGARMVRIRIDDQEEPKKAPINPQEIPPYVFSAPSLSTMLSSVVLDFGLLIAVNVIFFTAAFVAFQRYDLR